MAHQRKLIRQAAVALLVGAGTAAGSRVQGTRVEPHKKSQLPAISVYTLSEEIDQEATNETAPRELVRILKMEITAWVAHTAAIPVDDAMDNITEQIEAAMDSDPYLDSTAADSILESTETQVVEDDGRSDPLVGIVTLTYAVTYRTSPAAPTTLDDFLRVGADHRITGAVAENDAEDDFDVRGAP